MASPYEIDAFKFCMLCAGNFIQKSKIELECSRCGYVYFIASKPTASGIIVNSKNQILLIKRKRNPFKGSLDIPAGFCDATETLEECLIREMKEEVNIKVKNYKYFKSSIVYNVSSYKFVNNISTSPLLSFIFAIRILSLVSLVIE